MKLAGQTPTPADPVEPQAQVHPDESEKVSRLTAVWQSMYQRWKPWRDQALINYEFVIGNQLSKTVREELAAQKRPAMVFNLLTPLMTYIAGTLAANRTMMRAFPKRIGDELSSEMHTVLVNDWAMTECDANDEFTKAGLDQAICGLGWLNNRMDFSRDLEGKWITESVDPFLIMFDPDSRKLDGSDWRYYAVSGLFTADEIIAMHAQYLKPEKVAQIRQRAKDIEGTYNKLDKPQGWLARVAMGALEFLGLRRNQDGLTGSMISDLLDAGAGIYRVIEWHDRRQERVRVFYDPATRETLPIKGDPSDESIVAAMLQERPYGQVMERTVERLWRMAAVPALLPEALLFEEPYEVQNAGWQHKLVPGYDFHPDITRNQGIVNALIDPQNSYNQRRMTMLELLMDMVNPPVEAPEQSIDPQHMAAWTSKERGVIRFFKPQLGDMRPERKLPSAEAVAGLARFGEEDRDLVQKISGVTPNLQGLGESANEPASLYNSRVRQGMVMLQYFFAHLQRAQRSCFDYCDRSLQVYLTMPRAVRILGEPPAELRGMPGVEVGSEKLRAWWLKMNWPVLNGVLNDVRQGEYDFKPDVTQLGQMERQMKLLEWLEFVSKMPPEMVAWAEGWKLWDSPIAGKMAAFAEAVTKMKLMPPAPPVPPGVAGTVA